MTDFGILRELFIARAVQIYCEEVLAKEYEDDPSRISGETWKDIAKQLSKEIRNGTFNHIS